MNLPLLDIAILMGLFAISFRLSAAPYPHQLARIIAAALALALLGVFAAHWQAEALADMSARTSMPALLVALLLPALLLPASAVRGWLERWQQRRAGGLGVESGQQGLRLPTRLGQPTWVPFKTGVETADTGGQVWQAGGLAPDGAMASLELQHYDVLERIGIGGMGSVYLARPKRGGPEMALKIPQEKYLADQKFVTRFFREADILSRLNHPNIVKVHDYHAGEGEYYIAMEFVDGVSLEQALNERQFTLPEAVQIFRALTDALRHIHLQKVIHRDLKPANVMLVHGAWDEAGQLRRGGVKLMDFGVAVGQALSRLTMTGARVGTPSYMAPEQAKGVRTDDRSDIYSLGLLGYELVTGQPAFEGTYESVVHQQVFEDPRPPNGVRPDVPSRLSDLILQMIEKNPSQRPTLDEVLAALNDDILAEEAFDDKEIIVLGTEDPQSALRLLDTGGKLRGNWGNLRGVHTEGQLRLPGVPTALATYGGELLLAFTPEGREKAALVWRLDSYGRKLGAFANFGLGEGELVQPAGIARIGEKIFVLDAQTHFVNVYDSAGKFLFRFGGHGSAEGQFDLPTGLSAAGEALYVLDSGNHRVQRFSHRGEFVSRVAFRQGQGSDELRPLTGMCATPDAVYVVDAIDYRIRRVSKERSTTAPVTLLREVGEPSDAPWLLAVAPAGEIYAVPMGGTLLRIYAPTGELQAQRNMYTPVHSLTFMQREFETQD